MSKFSKTARYLMLFAVVFAAVFIIIGAALILTVFGRDLGLAGRYALGVLLGCAASVIKVPIMEGNINKTLDMPPGQARVVAPAQFFARNLLVVAALVISVLFPQFFNLIGAVLGVLSLQFAAYSLKIFKVI